MIKESSQNQSRLVEVRIHDYSPKGNGIGTYQHPQGKTWTLEVPFTMPGDLAQVIILKKCKGLHSCRLVNLIEPSLKRIRPRCLHFAHCGGCRWQHLSYEEQLAQKEALVRHSFHSLLTPESTLYPIVPCENPWEYRNKMEFSFSANLAGEKFLGLILNDSRGKVLNLTECHLVHPWFIDVLKAVRLWWEKSKILAYHRSKNSGSLRTLTLREGFRTGDKMVMLTVSGNPEYALQQQALSEFVASIKSAIDPLDKGKLSVFLRIQQISKGSPTNFYEILLEGPEAIVEILKIQNNDLQFNVSPSAFFQPNSLQAEKLYTLVIERANIPKEAIVYDLYCGTGTLGLCISKHVKEVISIELSPESSLDARSNISLNNISNVRVITGSVGKILAENEENQSFPPPDLVIVDPPRMGLDTATIKLLLKLKPSTIMYVSCNPVTQAQNIPEFIEGGYQLESLQPVDQFPQTVHIENIAILRRSISRSTKTSTLSNSR